VVKIYVKVANASEQEVRIGRVDIQGGKNIGYPAMMPPRGVGMIRAGIHIESGREPPRQIVVQYSDGVEPSNDARIGLDQGRMIPPKEPLLKEAEEDIGCLFRGAPPSSISAAPRRTAVKMPFRKDPAQTRGSRERE
jgi:hypothetical protein